MKTLLSLFTILTAAVGWLPAQNNDPIITGGTIPAKTIKATLSSPPIDLTGYFAVPSLANQTVVQFSVVSGVSGASLVTQEFNVVMKSVEAPNTVANFLGYVNGGSFANTVIHRSDQGLGIIQGGGYLSDPNLSVIPKNAPLNLEIADTLPNVRGTLAMARTVDPNSATSEWFINTVDNSLNNPATGAPILPAASAGGYAVFGRVTGTGMTVVDALQTLPVLAGNVTVTASSTANPSVQISSAPASFGPGWNLLGATVTSRLGNFVSLSGNANQTIDSTTGSKTFASVRFGAPFDQLPVLENLPPDGSVQLSNLLTVNSIARVPVFPVAPAGASVVKFSAISSNPSLVKPTVSGSNLYLAAGLNLNGSATVTVTATDSNGNPASASLAVSVVRNVVDFNSDSIPDLVLKYPGNYYGAWSPDASGAFKRWLPLSNGESFGTWAAVGVVDFDGDGVPDLILQYPGGYLGAWCPDATGAFKQWLPLNNGASFGAWAVAGTGDFNGDGIPDVILQYPGGYFGAWCPDVTGAFKQWLPLNNGASFGAWAVAGTGDFNGDGVPDLILQYSGGYVGAWCPDTTGAFKQWLPLNSGGSFGAWTVASSGDFNGDGIPDLILQYPGGYFGAWCSDGTGALKQWLPLNNGAAFSQWSVVR